MIENENIEIKGARVNNLKGIDVSIPRDQFVVITGLSGSGKSSLAFDTLYAEGQRRYVESLSSYARQFLGRMSKPECDYIKGIPPAIAIEQKVNTRNPRSTVGTSTEIYDYMRLLFARIGHTISPISGQEVKKHEVEDLIRTIQQYPQGTKIALVCPLPRPSEYDKQEQLKRLLKEGFTRLEYNGQFLPIEELLQNNTPIDSNYRLLIDRLSNNNESETLSRFRDSIETAFYEGDGSCILKIYLENEIKEYVFSKRFEADGMTFAEPSDLMFNFNSPAGACPQCEGTGVVTGIDPRLIIPDPNLSLYQDAVICWKGEVMKEWKNRFIYMAESEGFPIHTPYYQLTEEQKQLLWHGNNRIEGIYDFIRFLESNQYKIQYRVMLSRYRGRTICNVCNGSRLKPESMYVHVGGKNIHELVSIPIHQLKTFFEELELSEHEAAIAKRLLNEIKSRISFLMEVGLSYLTLDRLSSTLSGGESQRINLATSLGSALVGSLYILDEPSIGLHSRDTELLIKVLHKLKALGNTVVVVEHDEEIIRSANYIIDIGPDAGRLGGELIYQGDVSNLQKSTQSHTVRYLTGEESIPVPSIRRKWNQYINILGAAENNLKNIDVKIPLRVMTAVTGVSGSGKSTLVREILFNALSRIYKGTGNTPGLHKDITGDISQMQEVEFVDQHPIGKSSRSNPATYLKAFDEIRKLLSEVPLAKQMGFGASYFSFNVEDGRCEECKGEGTVTIPMQFMADIVLPCESCHGKRFKPEILEIKYRGANIHDMLEMTINDAITFFEEDSKNSTAKKIVKRLLPLQAVGLGYLKLGQSSSTLSGGENQRVKLAYYLANESQAPTLFIFDEPTTGLHFHDIKTLLKALEALIENGHTVLVIEHNMDVIKCADHIIDLGPEGGEQGGELIAEGTPEQVAKNKKSYTGKFLKEKLL